MPYINEQMKNRVLTLDIETTGLEPLIDKIVLIGYRVDRGELRFIVPGVGDSNDFRALLADSFVIKRGHNVKFDLRFLVANGFEVNGVLDDTRVLAYCANPFMDAGLKPLTKTILKRSPVALKDLTGTGRKRISVDKIDLEQLKSYCGDDVINCDDLRQEIQETAWFRDVEQPLTRTLFKAECRGIQLDTAYLSNLREEYQNRIDAILPSFRTLNPNSPKQVKEYFHSTGVDLSQFSEGEESTDKITLKRLSWSGNEFARTLLSYREISKLQSTYARPLLDKCDTNGRIHGAFNQAGTEQNSGGTATGRLTSSDPNLQNISARTAEGKRIRKAFIPSNGMFLIVSDLMQIEPRLVAHFSQSRRLLDAFAGGLDTHTLMAAGIFNKDPGMVEKMERFIGKTGWLGTVYGAFAPKLKYIVELNSEDPVPFDLDYYYKFQEGFWRANPDIRSWRFRIIEEARCKGYIETVGGRVIPIEGLHSRSKWERMAAERLVVNYTVQGSAADIMKLILIRFDRAIQENHYDAHILATVHDETLAEGTNDDRTREGLVSLLECIPQTVVTLNNVEILADTKIVNNWSEK